MSDLGAFLTARLDETEQQAREGEYVDLAPGWTAYILADVEAKRRILDLLSPPTDVDGFCDDIRAQMAQPYAGHEQFMEEWRVS